MIENAGEEFVEGEDVDRFEHFRLVVDKGQSPTRIDRFLTERIAYATRNKIQNAIDEGAVLVNGEPTKSNYKIKPDDLITIMLENPKVEFELIPEKIPLEILYEDDELLIVNKAAGMVVHPGHGNLTGTLVNALVYYFNQLPEMPGNSGRPGLVHRIDKDTSGLLVIAKSEKTMTDLAKQFFHHKIERTYVALIWGEPQEDTGTINVPIGRSVKDRKAMDAYPDESQGKPAITHWRVVKRLRYVSLIQCELETGRTHQIRAHMRYIGHPIFNDALYGGDKIRKGPQFSNYKAFVQNCFKLLPRQALHAQSLGFVHPLTKDFMHFEAPIPENMEEVIKKWENYMQFN